MLVTISFILTVLLSMIHFPQTRTMSARCSSVSVTGRLRSVLAYPLGSPSTSTYQVTAVIEGLRESKALLKKCIDNLFSNNLFCTYAHYILTLAS